MNLFLILCVLISITLEITESRATTLIKELTIFEDCGSIYDVIKVDIANCSSLPCRLPINRRVKIRTEFQCFGVPINQFLKHEVAWVLNNVNTRAHVAPDKCDGQICPYRTHYGFAFESDLMIKSTLPTIRGTLYWRSTNMYGREVVCFRVPILFVLP